MVKYFKDNFGLLLVRILAAIPIIIWFFMMPIADRFSSYGTIFRGLGQVTGLLGMALLSINFILSARFKFLDKWFAGLNRVYLRHHTIGILAFCLLLFHPTFLIIQYLFISLKASFNFILSFQNLYMILGDIALLVFIVLMVITIYLNFKYQNWKSTHQYLGAVLFLGGWHMLLVPSDVSNSSPLRYYMVILGAIGAYSYIYRTILGVYKKKEYKYKLEEVIKVNDSIVELKLKPIGSKINYLPGQFVFIKFEMGGVLSESHPFSITSSPDSNYLSLGIKTLGDYSSMVYLLKPGVICNIEGPFGVFSYLKAKSKRQIWIAGGIGITPFLGMARQIDLDKNKNSDYQIDLYYSVKNESETAFAGELAGIAERNNNFKLHQHFSDSEGYISARPIVIDNDDISAADVFLCGPGGFMQSLREQFVKLGWSNSRIHSEEFSF
jgi:predicted ferric reductase